MTEPLPRFVKVSSAGLLLPDTATDWEGVYVPAGQITLPRRLLLPGTGNWQWVLDQCAGVRACGFTDWQAISRLEFCNHLVDPERVGPCVDTGFFTVDDPYAWAWTRDECAPRGCAFNVDLYYGYVNRDRQSFHYSALPCRPGQLSWPSVGLAA